MRGDAGVASDAAHAHLDGAAAIVISAALAFEELAYLGEVGAGFGEFGRAGFDVDE